MKICTTNACHRFFATLANPTRLAILEILLDSPKNVAQLAQTLQQEQSMVSHNLQPLMECAFVFSEKKGKERIYSANKEVIEPLFHLFAFHESKYCPNGQTCLTRIGIKLKKKEEAQKELYVNHE